MKRITDINIDNCRAYFKEYNISLPNGENLLIYGENGSGKSSLFKSFFFFFKNAIKQQKFSKNLFNANTDGKLELSFSDFDINTGTVLSTTKYEFSNSKSNNNVSFIKDSSLLNGFLDYTDLLKIYLKSEPNPNLFDLIILNLLKEFIPVSTGSSSCIGDQYSFLIKNLITEAWTRKSRSHKLGLSKISDFESSLRLILDSIFDLVNKYLKDYFGLSDILIEHELKPIKFFYPNKYKSSWYLDSDLRLSIIKNNIKLGNEYKDYLNEARLSSVSICIYLASLKLFPNKVDYKLIYLDDIFIGIDTSNRIPIINILNNEFKDYQVIVSTYDKNFFQVCKYKLENNENSNLWKSIEIYVGEMNVNGKVIDIPIVLSCSSDIDKARYYLYNNEKPDYPASANYFRKYLESKLKSIFPFEIFRDNNFEEIDSYKLSKIFNLCNDFIDSLNIEIKEFKELNSYLFILLHPLSHYNSSIHTYKRDLKEIDNKISYLFEELNTLSFLKYIYFCCSRTNFRIEFYINQYNTWFYEFYIDKPLYFNLSNNTFSNSELICVKYYSTKNKKNQAGKSLNKNTSKIKYKSLEEANDEISKLILTNYRFFMKQKNLFNYVKIFDGTSWVNINLKSTKKNKRKK